jgi:hypothetical protein
MPVIGKNCVSCWLFVWQSHECLRSDNVIVDVMSGICSGIVCCWSSRWSYIYADHLLAVPGDCAGFSSKLMDFLISFCGQIINDVQKDPDLTIKWQFLFLFLVQDGFSILGLKSLQFLILLIKIKAFLHNIVNNTSDRPIKYPHTSPQSWNRLWLSLLTEKSFSCWKSKNRKENYASEDFSFTFLSFCVNNQDIFHGISVGSFITVVFPCCDAKAFIVKTFMTSFC